MAIHGDFPFSGKLRNEAYNVFGTVIVEPITSSKVFDGVSFAASKRFTIGSEGVVDLVFDGTAVTKEFIVFLPLTIKAFGAGPIYIDIYSGGDYSDNGTLIDCINRDTTSINDCESVIRLNPTITTTGTKLPVEFAVYSNGIPAVASLGGEVKEDFVLLLRKDVKYLIRMTNQEANAADAWFGFDWFEADSI